MKKHIASSSIAHVSDGDRHAVAARLHVLVMPGEDGGYFAQGIEIDYTATGDTEEAARDHFAHGFIETVRAYLRRGRDLSALYEKSRTPGKYVEAYYAAARKDAFGCVVRMDLGEEVAADVALPREFNFIPAQSAA